MATPVTAHNTSRNLSFLSMNNLPGFCKYRDQNKKKQTPTLTTLIPKGFASCKMVRCFTALRFIAKKRFVKRSATWAVVRLFNYSFLSCKNKGNKKAIMFLHIIAYILTNPSISNLSTTLQYAQGWLFLMLHASPLFFPLSYFQFHWPFRDYPALIV